MPGPPPSPNARRRNARPAFTQLPAAGRVGPAPAFPAGGRKSRALVALWSELWRSPQAVEWERLGWTRVVARYARLVLAAEAPGAKAALLSEVRQLEDRLGLSPMAMRRLQWEIEIAAPAPAPAASELSDVARLDEFRSRFTEGSTRLVTGTGTDL